MGPFYFGADANPVISWLKLQKLDPDYEGADWDTYEVPTLESRIMVETGLVSGVLCCDRLIYNGKNLLGLPLGEIRSILGPEDSITENISLGEAVYYKQLGLTLWLAGGVVRSATCNAIIADVTDVPFSGTGAV